MNKLHYTDSGLDNIYLAGGFEIDDTPRGKKVRIHDVHGLHFAIASALVQRGGALTGRESRFIRLELGYRQLDWAKLLGVTIDTVKGWETRAPDKPLQGPPDRLVRALWQEKCRVLASIAELCQRAGASSGRVAKQGLSLDLSKDGNWQPAIA